MKNKILKILTQVIVFSAFGIIAGKSWMQNETLLFWLTVLCFVQFSLIAFTIQLLLKIAEQSMDLHKMIANKVFNIDNVPPSIDPDKLKQADDISERCWPSWPIH